MSRSAWAGVLSSSLNSARYIAIRTPSRQSETAMLLIVRTLRRRLRKLFLRINDRFRDIARTSGRMRSLKKGIRHSSTSHTACQPADSVRVQLEVGVNILHSGPHLGVRQLAAAFLHVEFVPSPSRRQQARALQTRAPRLLANS